MNSKWLILLSFNLTCDWLRVRPMQGKYGFDIHVQVKEVKR